MLAISNGKLITSNGKLCTTCCTSAPEICPCSGYCYQITYSGGGGSCSECLVSSLEGEFVKSYINNYDCVCTQAEYEGGFCISGNKNYITFTWENSPGGPCEPDPPFIVNFVAELSADCPPTTGNYLLYPTEVSAYCDQPISAYVERILCCTDQPTETYYISCDMVFSDHYDAAYPACAISGCDGSPTGTLICSDSGSLIDWPILPYAPCDWRNEDALLVDDPSRSWACQFDYYDGATWGGTVTPNPMMSYSSGVWYIGFAGWGSPGFTTGPYYLTSKVGGFTPVGTYPDINVCVVYAGGCNSVQLDITNIVITA